MGFGSTPGIERHIRLYRNGRDLTATPREVMVIDLFGLTAEEVRTRFPAVYQWIYERVKPERDQNRDRPDPRELVAAWTILARSCATLWPGCRDIIATVETSRRRFFVFLDAAILPDNKLINIALDDAYFLGVLSSRIHVTWALAAGSHLGVGNDPVYVKTACFEKFPFPAATDAQQARIRGLAEQLDAHRKRQQAQHPKLALTDMYNVLEKLRAGEPLTAKDKAVHEQGLVSVLRQIHDELDAAVCDAYGWPVTLDRRGDPGAAGRAQRRARRRGSAGPHPLAAARVPGALRSRNHAITQHALIQEDAPIYEVSLETRPLLPWPTRMAEQAQAVRAALVALGGPASAAQVAAAFAAAPPDRVAELLETLVTLGQARGTAEGRFVG